MKLLFRQHCHQNIISTTAITFKYTAYLCRYLELGTELHTCSDNSSLINFTVSFLECGRSTETRGDVIAMNEG